MTQYTKPALDAVNFPLTVYTRPDIAPYTVTITACTIADRSAVNFALTPYTPPVFKKINFEIGTAAATQLTVQDMVQGQTIEAITITAHIPNWVLTVADLAQAQTIGDVTLTAHVPTFALTVEGLTQTQTIDTVTLSAHVPAFTLAVADMTQVQTIGIVSLIQHHVLAVQDITQAQTIDSVKLHIDGEPTPPPEPIPEPTPQQRRFIAGEAQKAQDEFEMMLIMMAYAEMENR